MADNVTLPGTGSVVSAKDVSGRYLQDVILALVDGNRIGGETIGPGYGLYVINLAKQESQGVYAVGDDVTTGALPVYLGAYACTTLATPAPQTDGLLQALKVTADGRLLTLPFANPEDTLQGFASDSTGASTEVIAAQAATIRTYVTWITVTNLHATVAQYVAVKNGTTVMDAFFVPAASSRERTYPTPLRGAAATAWNFDPLTAQASTECAMGGYKSKV